MDNLSNFSETLDSLMFENEVNASQLSQSIGVSLTTVTRYLRAERTPSVENAVKLAQYFDCSVEYLLGRETEKYNRTFYPCPPFSEQLKALKQSFQCPWWHFYKTAHVSSSRFYEWKNGTHSPTLDCIIALADGFNCTVDFIIGRTK